MNEFPFTEGSAVWETGNKRLKINAFHCAGLCSLHVFLRWRFVNFAATCLLKRPEHMREKREGGKG